MFYDIFSKKEIRTNQKKERPKIIADIHEKDSMILSELKSNKEIDLEITSLEIGDYQVGGTIIERKTTSDFISSIITKRLIRQIIQMQQYEQKVIIIEGEINDLYNKINPNAVRGFILSISLNYNINLIFTTSYKDTTAYLITLAKQELKPKTAASLHSKIPKTKSEQRQYVLESFPGIGPKKAELLLKKFNNLKSTFNADEEELKEILKSQAKCFKEILNS